MKFLLCLLLTCPILLSAAENLIKNGDLEQGSGHQPTGWSRLDRITVKWIKSGNPGRCLLMNTAVQQKDKAKYKDNPEGYVPSNGGQFSTVGAHEGVWAFAAPVDLPPDTMYYIISCDIRATERSTELFYPQILLRGFQKVTEKNAGKNSSWFHEHFEDGVGYSEQFGSDKLRRNSRAGDYLMVWRQSVACRISEPHRWTHFELGIKLPKEPRFRPQRLLVKPYAIWPLGIYEFDNLILVPATKAQFDEVMRRRKQAGPSPVLPARKKKTGK